MAYKALKLDLERAALIMEGKVSFTPEYAQKSTRLSIKAGRNSDRDAHDFERDYPAFLLALASSIRTGLDPLQALIESAKLFNVDSTLSRQIEKLKKQIEQGSEESTPIADFASSISHPDIALFRTAYLLARQHGSSLAECLQRLARITRHRQSFRRKAKSAVAMQKLSAFSIGACAILICLIQSLANPKIVFEAWANPLGQRLLIIGIVLIIFGLVWMMRLTKSRI
jgi:Flp pilus assembly protein TadB